MSQPAPNESLQALESVLGSESTREIVRLFLHDFPVSFNRVVGAGREDQMRIVHGIKSSALHMGAMGLSARMGSLEQKLGNPGETLTPEDIAAALADFGAVEGVLREYSGS